ncbi:hypothetical protein P4O66_021530 [Electrophorus voltai]|uniref:Uncharacterized protein n=1 Tax=Electrophorus voltai TaxID=2609070 RepID=A0AAD8ZR41_9TELE|nr:hypothetical protein P4O66_021530 [Electrophorus voltai]
MGRGSLELPFMMMSHPLIPVSLPPASVTMAMNQMNHLSTIANMAAAAHVPARMATSVIKERVPDSPSPAPSLDDGRRSVGRLSSRQSSSASSSPAHTESSSDRPRTPTSTPLYAHPHPSIPPPLYTPAPDVHQNGLSLGHALLGLSPSAPPGPKEGDLATQDTCHDTRRTPAEKGLRSVFQSHSRACLPRLAPYVQVSGLRSVFHSRTVERVCLVWLFTCRSQVLTNAFRNMLCVFVVTDETMLGMPTSREGFERVSHAGPTLPPGFPGTLLFPEGLSSIETLLTNIQARAIPRSDTHCCPGKSLCLHNKTSTKTICDMLYLCLQGLLKVAVDNARAQEKQVQLEKTELKMELCRERELRETLERQLCVEQKNRALIQKRLKKEKKTKRKLQEALEYESKRRDQAEKTLQQTATSELARSPNGGATPLARLNANTPTR